MGVQCAEAVLRGADVFAPGVMATPKGIAHIISIVCGCVQVCVCVCVCVGGWVAVRGGV